MKYMLSWTERPQGSAMEYENAQKRILEVFTQWKAPGNFKIELFVIRVGDWGGYMLLDCDDPTAVHKFCSMLPAFVFEARPVIPIEDAVRVELEAIAFRDGLKRKWLSEGRTPARWSATLELLPIDVRCGSLAAALSDGGRGCFTPESGHCVISMSALGHEWTHALQHSATRLATFSHCSLRRLFYWDATQSFGGGTNSREGT
jgi:muconolactone delta-isomerase